MAYGTIRIGKMKIPDEVLHHKIKPNILGALDAKKYSWRVGNNPNINVKNGEIILEGTGPYKGKSWQTGLKASEYFQKF